MAMADTEGAARPVHSETSTHASHSTPALMLGALGVVFGDIGTSPIYAFREALHAAGSDGAVTRGDILAVLSMIVWALTLIVTIKYVVFVMRADNNGEGGSLSLMALARANYPKGAGIILIVGIISSALFFGDAIITPAISVLSAVEGLKLVTPAFDPYIEIIALVILAVLFAVQRLGTASVARVFGPVMALWFLMLGGLGLYHIADAPEVFLALNPYYAIHYLIAQPELSFITIGAVFLAVTGAEALYVDLGHFGRKPIVTSWLFYVFPALLLNYFGQGAFVLANDGVPTNPFYEIMPSWFLIPGVLITMLATVIASQAVITGAYSLARQAVQLNILPRFEVQHTSESVSGQIYMPRINLLLALGVILLVVGFGESSALASAYGISVTGVMLMTTVLLCIVMVHGWKWRAGIAVTLCVLFGILDGGFLLSNVVKIHEGGWVSILVAGGVGLIMWTWVKGTRYLFDKTRKSEIPFGVLVENLSRKPPHLVQGTAVFLTSDPASAPTALMHSLKHYKVLHQQNVILSVTTAQEPKVPESERVKMEPVNELFMRVTLKFGYMEQPNIPRALAICRKQGWKFDIMTTSFFLSRRSFKASSTSGMPIWQDKLFIGLARSAADATEYFQIPTGRVVEIGTQVAI